MPGNLGSLSNISLAKCQKCLPRIQAAKVLKGMHTIATRGTIMHQNARHRRFTSICVEARGQLEAHRWSRTTTLPNPGLTVLNWRLHHVRHTSDGLANGMVDMDSNDSSPVWANLIINTAAWDFAGSSPSVMLADSTV
jgi:hypothetical protein